jgi:hypothetical protein
VTQAGEASFHADVGDRDSVALLVDEQGVLASECQGAQEVIVDPLVVGDHNIELIFRTGDASSRIVLSYKGPDTGHDWIVVPPERFLEQDCGALYCAEPDELGSSAAPGLCQVCLDFHEKPDNWCEVPPETPDPSDSLSRTCATNIEIENTSNEKPEIYGYQTPHRWAARFNGKLFFQNTGSYTFWLDIGEYDSAALLIDGAEIQRSDCAGEKWVGVEYVPCGTHDIEVVFSDVGGTDRMILWYQGPDTGDDRIVVPSARFVPRNCSRVSYTLREDLASKVDELLEQLQE